MATIIAGAAGMFRTPPVGAQVCPAGYRDFWEHEGELFEYPPTLCIRNTFVDSVATRSPSLDEYFSERQVRSCPSSMLETIDHPSCDDADSSHCAHSSTSAGSSRGTSMGKDEPDEVFADSEQCCETPLGTVPALVSLGSMRSLDSQLTVSLPSTSPSEDAAPLNVGSAAHGSRCKPCAFFHTKGCESGASCVFCHLCPPLEKKRRKKERTHARSFARNMQRISSNKKGIRAELASAILKVPVALGMTSRETDRIIVTGRQEPATGDCCGLETDHVDHDANVQRTGRTRWSEESEEEGPE